MMILILVIMTWSRLQEPSYPGVTPISGRMGPEGGRKDEERRMKKDRRKGLLEVVIGLTELVQLVYW